MRLGLAAFLLLATAGTVHAERAAPVLVGDHRGFGRLVFDFAAPTTFGVSEQGDEVALTFSGSQPVGMPPSLPRNLLSVVVGVGRATLTLAPGARVRPTRMGNRVVLDLVDPPATPARPADEARPATAGDAALLPVPSTSAQPPLVPGPLRLPAGPGVGAAAFRRGDTGVVVLDRRLALDAVRINGTAGFEAATWRGVGDLVVLTVPLGADQGLTLSRDGESWTVPRGEPADSGTVEQTPLPNGIGLSMPHPGRVVAIQDPLTGQALLVGTANPSSGAGRSVAVPRTAPGYALLPTWLGVAVEPNSDRIELRGASSGYVLLAPDLSPGTPAAAAAPTRRFDFPAQSAAVLSRRLQAQIAGAAALPPRARGRERVVAAQTMLALGMAPEAQAVLSLAAAEDPETVNDATATGLAAIAAVLAGRPEEAGGLDDPRLDGTDEMALWRGLRDRARGKPTGVSGAELALAMTYPEALQHRVLPEMAEAAVTAGSPIALDAVLPNSPRLAFARAMQQERTGALEAALNAYQAIAAGRDRSDAVRATIKAAELLLTAGRATAAATADTLERQTVAWRGDTRESAARLRVAELRMQAGEWRRALESLRETERLFPSLKPDTTTRKSGVFHALLSAPKEGVPALQLISLAEEFADCVPDGPEGVALAGLLADKLVELDLPSRALPVLQKLMQSTAPGPAQAGFGLRVAQLLLDGGEPAKAEAVLSKSDQPGLGREMSQSSALLHARARAAQGDIAGAVTRLAALDSPAADDLRATLLGQASDWRGSLAALDDLARKTIPETGDLSTQQQDVLLRQASAATQAGDREALQRLGGQTARLVQPRADLFRTLTAPPVQGVGDLGRNGQEMALAHAIPQRLQALARP